MADNPVPPQVNDPHAELREGEEAPPPGVKTMAIVRWAILIVSAIAALATTGSYIASRRPPGSSTSEPKYYCPMHPQITSSVPGECPICQMTLEPIPANRHTGGLPAPMQTEASTAQGSAPANRVPITLNLDRVQAIGVRTAVATMRSVSVPSRVTATVATPEQGAASVHTRAAGYVERIDVEQTGVKVGKGQELVAIYSPEIYQAETELLTTRSWNAGDGGLSLPARQKLELLGMPPGAIDRVLATGAPLRAVGILAPTTGYVTKKNVVLGSFVTPETELYELADLSRVYIVAEVPQGDMGTITVGTSGSFTRRDRPGGSIQGKVDLIYPTVNPEARTTRVRMSIQNPKLELRPGEFGTVDFAAPERRALVVPRDAVVDTGASVYVYVDEGNGRYAPRVVTLGADLDPDVEIVAGLSEGERVVSGATFLLDSESALQASAAGASSITLSGAPSALPSPSGPPPKPWK